MAATGEYTQFFGGTVLQAMAAIVTTVNSVNAIYNAEIGVHLTLIGDNDDIVYTDATSDPFPLTNKNAETQAAIDAAIGSSDYDIGHLFHRAGSSISGNAGCIGCVCTAGSKGSGWSQGPNPGDGNFVFLVSHEMGHQHGANHTWNGPGCGGEESPARYEPGSGTTIMSYSSICGADNIQGSQVGDLYFHAGSRVQITTYVGSGGGNACGTDTALPNAIPTVSAGADHTIPRGTPFVLTATGSDGDGNPLTFGWEQYDIGDKAALNAADNGNIPLFRSFPPTASPSRTLPTFADLLAGPGSLFPSKLGEQLPSTDRSLNFRVTARDNVAGGGGADDDQMTITVLGDPFQVTSPGTGAGLECGVNDTLTWNVGGGNVAPTVDIRLSTDGGGSFPLLLAAGTGNDGSQSVAVPATLAPDARVRIDSVGNIFFALSSPTAIEDTLDPSIACPADIVVECTGNGGATADNPQIAAFLAGASGSDACDPSVDIGNDAPAFFGLGDTLVTFTATDASGNSALCAAKVTVADTQPPTISASVSPDLLWPPNHKLVNITAAVEVADVCNPSPTFVLTSIASSEPDNGLGDGDTTGDIQGVAFGTPDTAFQLRAERSGRGPGRLYTILYTASDGSGNTAPASDVVLVPHNGGKK